MSACYSSEGPGWAGGRTIQIDENITKGSLDVTPDTQHLCASCLSSLPETNLSFSLCIRRRTVWGVLWGTWSFSIPRWGLQVRDIAFQVLWTILGDLDTSLLGAGCFSSSGTRPQPLQCSSTFFNMVENFAILRP